MADKKTLVNNAGQAEQLQAGDSIDAGSARIKNVATPSIGTDAVNKDYADSLTTGGGVSKSFVIAMATAL